MGRSAEQHLLEWQYPWNRQTDEFGNAVLGLDYRGENARFGSRHRLSGRQSESAVALLFVLASPILPPPPKAGTNFQVPWAYYEPTDFFTTARGEVDVADWLTAYAAFGYHDSNINYTYPSPDHQQCRAGSLTSPGHSSLGGLRSNPLAGSETFETFAGEAGLRANVDTGPVNHAVNVNYSINDRTYRQRVLSALNPSPLTQSVLYLEPLHRADQYCPTEFHCLGRKSTHQCAARKCRHCRYDVVAEQPHSVHRWCSQPDGRKRSHKLSCRAAVSGRFRMPPCGHPAYALVVKPVENISLYANYIEGLQTPHVVDRRELHERRHGFPPGRTTQAEAGVKIDTGRLTTTLSLFEIEQRSIITVAGAAGQSQLLNGRQRNRGAELNVFGEITPRYSGARWCGVDRWQTGQHAQRGHRRQDGDRRSRRHSQHRRGMGYAVRAWPDVHGAG